jgi:hypothetical protein
MVLRSDMTMSDSRERGGNGLVDYDQMNQRAMGCHRNTMRGIL